MILEPYQSRAAEWLAKTKRGAVISPAGSGKTIIAAAGLDRVLRSKPRSAKVKIGWVAFTREQIDQANAAISQFPAIQELADVDAQCAQAGTDWSEKAVIVIDESHRSLAPSFFAQVQTCNGAIWGFTATPKTGEPERDKQFDLFFGNNFFVIDRKEVANRLVAARVVMLDASDDVSEKMDEEIGKLVRRRMGQIYRRSAPTHDELLELACKEKPDSLAKLPDPPSYAALCRILCFVHGPITDCYNMVAGQVVNSIGIVQNVKRNQAIVDVAVIRSCHMSMPTLILVNQVEHGLHLAQRIPAAQACYSKMGAKKRRETLDAFRAGQIRCLIATSLADEGLDLPMAEVLIQGSGGRSAAKAEQRTGRVLRTFAGKTEGIIYDFLDRQHPTMERQSKARMALYRKLGYRIKLAS